MALPVRRVAGKRCTLAPVLSIHQRRKNCVSTPRVALSVLQPTRQPFPKFTNDPNKAVVLCVMLHGTGSSIPDMVPDRGSARYGMFVQYVPPYLRQNCLTVF